MEGPIGRLEQYENLLVCGADYRALEAQTQPFRFDGHDVTSANSTLR